MPITGSKKKKAKVSDDEDWGKDESGVSQINDNDEDSIIDEEKYQ